MSPPSWCRWTRAGVSVGSPDKKMGQAASHIADVILEDVHLPAEALLGTEEGKGFVTAMKSLDNGRLSVAAAATGYAQRALDSRDPLRQRAPSIRRADRQLSS